MKFFTLSIALASLLLVGCGGSDSKKSNTEDEPQVTTLEDSQKDIKSLTALSNIKKAFSALSSNPSSKSAKVETLNCSTSGTISFNSSEGSDTNKIMMNKCQNKDLYMDGELSITQYNEYHAKIEMKNFTIKDKEMTVIAKSFITEDNSLDHWYTLDGDMSIASKCFTGNFNMNTLERLVDAQDNTENIESGKIELNKVTYSFENPYVTLTAGSESKTMLQSELDKELTTETACEE